VNFVKLKEIADLISITESTIKNLENNRNGVELLARVAKLCAALKCTAQDLIDFEEEKI
jgi:DNA-binding Xre family transcriptional regulator